MIAVKPGGFQMPLTNEQTSKILTRVGNAGSGGRPNPPTIVPQQPGSFPRVNLNPVFQIGAYNNAEESYHYPRFTEYWKQQHNTNNPVRAAAMGKGVQGGIPGNSGDGGNETKLGTGYGVRPWAPYDLGQLGVDSGISQSFPYNKNSTNLEGEVFRTWQFSDNMNFGEPNVILAGKPSVASNNDFNMQDGLVTGKGGKMDMGNF